MSVAIPPLRYAARRWGLAGLVVHLGIVASYNRLAAQCPDGSAPPCRRPAPSPPADPNVLVILPFEVTGAPADVAWLGEGMVVPTLQNLITGTGRPENRGMLVAFYVSSTRTGQTVGPIVAGRLLGAAGAAGAFGSGLVVSLGLGLGTLLAGRRRAAAGR